MDGFVLVVLLSITLRGRQVHSVAVVVLPVRFIVKWLCVLRGNNDTVLSRSREYEGLIFCFFTKILLHSDR